MTLAETGLVQLQGPNGSGKSTFAELVSGYLRPWSGHVRVFGLEASSAQARGRRRVCRAAPALFPLMTTHDHIALASTARGADRQLGLERAERLGLSEWLGENAGTLSTGTAKKLWYLINTLGEFDLAVLDEPFNGVDKDSIAVMAGELAQFSRHGSVMLIAHALTDEVILDRTIDIRELASGL